MEDLYIRQIRRLKKHIEMGNVKTDKLPTRWQLWAGMVAYFPEYVSQFGEQREGKVFPQWLSRMPQRSITLFMAGAYEPFDTTGLSRKKEGIIWHLVTCIHNGIGWTAFDLMNLSSFDNGLEDLIGDLKAILAGTHPHTWIIKQWVGDPSYHPRLLQEAYDAQKGIYAESDPPERTLQGVVDWCLSFPETLEGCLKDERTRQLILGAPIGTLQELGRHVETASEKLSGPDQHVA